MTMVLDDPFLTGQSDSDGERERVNKRIQQEESHSAALLLANHLNLQQQHNPYPPSASAFATAVQVQHQRDVLQSILAQQKLLPLGQGLQQAGPTPLTHNLIPVHLQSTALGSSFHGTPGYQPAVIPAGFASNIATIAPSLASSVQDHPMVLPVYNGVNPNYPGLRVLNTAPPIFTIDDFLSPMECEFLVHAAADSFGPAPVVGKGSGEVSPSRTSSTCYLAREDLPDYLRKVSLLTGKPVEHCELPQVGRYLPSQQYLQHFDAFDLSNEDGRRFAANGGQRTVTVLVYLNHVASGGATAFPALNLHVQPRQGMALIFFPATIDGYLDKMVLHAAMPAIDVKFVSQVWIRQGEYKGQPSKRLTQTLGVPFGQAPIDAAVLRQHPF